MGKVTQLVFGIFDQVRIAPEEDQRHAQTKKAPHVLKREEAQRHPLPTGMDTSPGTTSVRRMGVYVGAAIALAVVLGLGVIGFTVVTRVPGATSTPGAANQPAAPSAATSPTAPGARFTPVTSTTLGTPATPPASAVVGTARPPRPPPGPAPRAAAPNPTTGARSRAATKRSSHTSAYTRFSTMKPIEPFENHTTLVEDKP